MKIISGGLVCLILTPVAINLLLILFGVTKYDTSGFYQWSDYYSEAHSEVLIKNCARFVYRNILENFYKILIDILLGFILPLISSCYFYVKIGLVLLKREKDQERNRTLVLAFALSWLLWILCWVPYYVILLSRLSLWHKRRDVIENDFLYTFKERIVLLKENICLLYSHLNPVLFIVILKPLQDKAKNWFNPMFRSHKTGFGVLKNENSRVKNSLMKAHSPSFLQTEQTKELTKLKFRKAISFSTCTLAFVVALTLIATSVLVYINGDVAENLGRHVLRVPRARQNQLDKIWKLADLVHDSFIDPREFCAEKGGNFNLDLGRCYIIANHPEGGM